MISFSFKVIQKFLFNTKKKFVHMSKICSCYSKPSTVIEVAEKKIEIPKPKPSYNQPNKVCKYTTSLPGLFYCWLY